jgi:hypothetical protein
VAPDRRFGLPHPLDAEPSEDSSNRRKTGIWQSLKRALGTSPGGPPLSDQAPAGERPAPPRPAATPWPNSIPTELEAKPVPERAGMPAPRPADGLVVPIVEDVPFLTDSVAPEPSPEDPAPASVDRGETENVTDAAARKKSFDSAAERPGRLARGLASFSRDNAEREKKFAHLIRDANPATKKTPPGSRKPG